MLLELLFYLAIGVVALVAAALLYLVLSPRLEITCDLSGQTSTDRYGEEFVVSEEASRQAKEFPPVYPNGWYGLLLSHELNPCQIKLVTAFGKELVVFRDEKGGAHVLDAFCLDLEEGGNVEGSCLSCAFHGESCDPSDAEFVTGLKGEKGFEGGKVEVWSHCEKNGAIMAWFHADGEPPQWKVLDVPEINEGKWEYRGSVVHSAMVHVQDIIENGADFSHFTQIHSHFILTGKTVHAPWWHELIFHKLKTSWELGDEPHLSKIQVAHRMLILGHPFTFADFKVDLVQVGPALVYLWIKTKFGTGFQMLMIKPEGPFRQKLSFAVFAPRTILDFMPKAFLFGQHIQISRDIVIWRHKRYNRKPVLVKEDHTILKFRRWYSQFYSEHSPTVKAIRESLLEGGGKMVAAA